MAYKELTQQLKEQAKALGFDLSGVCNAVAPTGAQKLDDWLAAGYAGQMSYLANRREAYSHPRHLLDGVRSILMLGMHYQTEGPATTGKGQGRMSRYAWGSNDYHDVIRSSLHELADYLRELSPGALTRGIVDTAPFLEREFAQLAGLGWVGKNTMLISPQAGSYFFLAALLTDIRLDVDSPHKTDHCGSCTACLEACPTDAFPQAYVLDGSKCISYLTIELQDTIPIDLRQGMGDWLFGCDICQDVCPWNRHAPVVDKEEFQPLADTNPVELAALFDLDDQQFRTKFRKTPVWRAHRRGLLRNAAIVLGNQEVSDAVDALRKGLRDAEPLVRGACAWALGQIRSETCFELLDAALHAEKNTLVRQEIVAALAVVAERT